MIGKCWPFVGWCVDRALYKSQWAFGSYGTVEGGLKYVEQRKEWGTHTILFCKLEVGGI